MKRKRSVEGEAIAIWAATLLGVAIGLSDFGRLIYLHFRQHQDQSAIPAIILICVGLLLGFVSRYYRRLTHIEQTLQRDLIEPEWARHLLDPNLEKVIGDYIVDRLRALNSACLEKTYRLPKGDFASFYMRVLKAFPGATFLATSIPRDSVLWGNAAVMRVVREFLQSTSNRTGHAGKMRRIFFLDSADDLQDTEVLRILEAQQAMGVEVYTLVRTENSIGREPLVLVDVERRIGWELEVQKDGAHVELLSCKLTAAPDVLRAYINDWEALHASATRWHG